MNDTRARAVPQVDTRRDLVYREHRHLHDCTAKIVATTEPDELPQLMHRFRDSLVAHYALEEGEGGLFDSIRAEAPHLARRVAELEAEHLAFVAELSQLVPAPGTPVGPGTHARLIGLIGRIREHDRRENALLLESVQTDLGGRG